MTVGVEGVTTRQSMFSAALTSEHCCGNDCRVPWSAVLPTYLSTCPSTYTYVTYRPTPCVLSIP